ncbi:MAG: helix-turn-helix domain-containing protein [Ruminococcus sp.]|nr:helix-turn-helix domain-containing protein [Ruminococcus sp.]MCD7812016.1 helix-turn-helix domain-containing protein [Ruminococcus sp.]
MMKTYQMMRDYRKKRGITQTHVAKQAGITPARLSQLETGLVRLTADEFLTIVIDGFGTTPQIFFDEQLSKIEK